MIQGIITPTVDEALVETAHSIPTLNWSPDQSVATSSSPYDGQALSARAYRFVLVTPDGEMPADAKADIGFLWRGQFQREKTITANSPSAVYSMAPTGNFVIRKHASTSPVGVVMIGAPATIAQPQEASTMATTTTFARASTRTFLLWTIHVVEMVTTIEGEGVVGPTEAVGPVLGIFPDEAAAQAYAQTIPTTTVSD